MRPQHSPTADTAARLRVVVARLGRLLRDQAHTGHTLTLTQVGALATLERRGAMPIGALAAEEHVTPPTATKTVDKLEAAGLVARTPDPDDRRVALVSLTDTGRETLATSRARKTAWLTRSLDELEADELRTVEAATEILDRLVTRSSPATAPDAPDADHPVPTPT